MNLLPCCFYPSTIIAVDDDPKILKLLELNSCDHNQVQTFTDPQEAISFINAYKFRSFATKCIQQKEEHNLDIRQVQVNLNGIHEHILDNERFHEISVIIVDYSMPVMNGFELCQKLNNAPYKIIMLTGEADESQGLKAFNHKLISKFHQKGEANIYEHLGTHIREKQIEYFQELSQPIINALQLSPDPVPACMLDESIVEPFFQLLESLDIAEYYLYSYSGVFLTMTYNGQKQWLVIKDDDEMEVELQIAEGCYDNDPSPEAKDILESIKQKQKIPLFLTVEDSNLPMNQWKPFLAKTNILQGRDKIYYYAFFDHDGQQLGPNTVTNFNSQ